MKSKIFLKLNKQIDIILTEPYNIRKSVLKSFYFQALDVLNNY
jgi:hypothetical protein